MAVTDLHSLDISTAIDKIFTGGEARGAVLSLIDETPSINVGENKPLVMSGRAKGALVHEGGVKPDNGRQIVSKPFTTVKLVYSQRVTDEFMMWDRERQGDFVSRLVSDWTRKSLPRDIDTVVLHGLDPNTNTLDTNLSDYLTKTGSSIAIPASGTSAAQIDADFNRAMDDDFNTALAISNLFGLFKSIKAKLAAGDATVACDVNQIRKTYALIGLFTQDANAFIADYDKKHPQEEVPLEVKAIADERFAARQNKDWAKSDELRDKLAELGYVVKDAKDGYTLIKK